MNTFDDSLIDTEEQNTTRQERFALANLGLKLELLENIFIHTANAYSWNGEHNPALGLEFKRNKSSYLASHGYQESAGLISRSYSSGFIKAEDNVKWGLGASYTKQTARSESSIPMSTWAINYISEISF